MAADGLTFEQEDLPPPPATPTTGTAGTAGGRQQRGRGTPGKRASAGGSGQAAKKDKKVCFICLDPDKACCGNNPFCHECKREVDAMKKDAQTN
eukprot:9000427-Pyramimonas_sp.AAC.1